MKETVIKKLPEITLIFWIMKICATTLGETGGDLLAQTLKVGYGVSSVILISFFLVTLTSQLFVKKYNPVLYWLVILSTSTAGTTMSDYMDRTLGLGYAKGSLILVSILLVIFGIWKLSKLPMSIEKIRTFKGEFLYWIAILFSNTLGTALGDFLSDTTKLGYIGGAVLIGGLLLIIVLAKQYTKISTVVLFWIAFVLTRPFGATFGDLLTKSYAKGGLNFGTAGASIVLAVILTGFIVYTYIQETKKNKSEAETILGLE